MTSRTNIPDYGFATLSNLAFQAIEEATGAQVTAKFIERLSRKYGPQIATWAISQAACRLQARAKFVLADQMLFTKEALEQATHEKIAAYHSSAFPEGSKVCDLTVGIGADSIAFAKRGSVVGFDLDEERLQYAAHNLQVHSLNSASLVARDSMAGPVNGEFAFADPGRRVEGQRTREMGEFTPSPSQLAELFKPLRLGGIKLSPMLSDESLLGLGTRLEFISYGRECREAIIWVGKEAVPTRQAVHIESGEVLDAKPLEVEVPFPSQYLYEANPAAIRAHCLGHFAMPGLGDSNGYLTSNEFLPSVWLRPYEVHYSGPADAKATRRALQNLNCSTPEIKVRGAKLDVKTLQKNLESRGALPCVVAVWPVGRSLRHAILIPVA